jgi:hypothetical protein
MTITSIALDDLVTAFTDALAEANRKIEERCEVYRNQLKEKYGEDARVFYRQGNVLRIKGGAIKVTAQPLIKEEKVNKIPVHRIYLKFGGLNRKELTFEVVLEK